MSSSSSNGESAKTFSSWILTVVGTILALGVLGLGASQIQTAERLSVQETKSVASEKRLERIEEKLDRILTVLK